MQVRVLLELLGEAAIDAVELAVELVPELEAPGREQRRPAALAEPVGGGRAGPRRGAEPLVEARAQPPQQVEHRSPRRPEQHDAHQPEDRDGENGILRPEKK